MWYVAAARFGSTRAVSTAELDVLLFADNREIAGGAGFDGDASVVNVPSAPYCSAVPTSATSRKWYVVDAVSPAMAPTPPAAPCRPAGLHRRPDAVPDRRAVLEQALHVRCAIRVDGARERGGVRPHGLRGTGDRRRRLRQAAAGRVEGDEGDERREQGAHVTFPNTRDAPKLRRPR